MKILKTLIISIVSLCCITGCRVIQYENKIEGRKVTYTIVGLSTKVGGLEIQTHEGSILRLTDSQTDASAAINLATKAMDKIPVVVP